MRDIGTGAALLARYEPDQQSQHHEPEQILVSFRRDINSTATHKQPGMIDPAATTPNSRAVKPAQSKDRTSQKTAPFLLPPAKTSSGGNSFPALWGPCFKAISEKLLFLDVTACLPEIFVFDLSFTYVAFFSSAAQPQVLTALDSKDPHHAHKRL